MVGRRFNEESNHRKKRNRQTTNKTNLDKLFLELLRFHERQPVAKTGDLPQGRMVDRELSVLHINKVLKNDCGADVKHANRVLLGRERRSHWKQHKREERVG